MLAGSYSLESSNRLDQPKPPSIDDYTSKLACNRKKLSSFLPFSDRAWLESKILVRICYPA